MNFRRALIIFSAFAITANVTAAVSADQPSTNTHNHGSLNFHYVGIRSHGYPVENWQDQSNGDDNSGGNGSPQADTLNNDKSWLTQLASEFKRQNKKGYYSPVGSPATKPISCHSSCTTLTGTISLIPVWVGNWSSGDVTTWNSVLGNIVTSLGGSSANSVVLAGHVFNTTTLYYTSQSLTPPSLQWVSNLAVTAPTATSVSDADVATYINTFIAANPTIVPDGTTPVFIYLGASSTLLTSGFGTTYCGWHTYGTSTSGIANIPYIALQDFTSTYYKTCAPQTSSPNGNVGLDAMASVMVHEVDETLTDPFFTGWYDSTGAESADKCVRTYGTLHTVGTARYNVQLGSLNYLIQQNWLENNLVTPTGTSSGTACSVTG